MKRYSLVLDRDSVVHMISSPVGIPLDSPEGYNEFVYWDVPHLRQRGVRATAASLGHLRSGCRITSRTVASNLRPGRAETFFHFSGSGDIIEIVDGRGRPHRATTASWTGPFDGPTVQLDAGYRHSAHHDRCDVARRRTLPPAPGGAPPQPPCWPAKRPSSTTASPADRLRLPRTPVPPTWSRRPTRHLL